MSGDSLAVLRALRIKAYASSAHEGWDEVVALDAAIAALEARPGCVVDEAMHIRTGVLDKSGREICAGDRIVYRNESKITKEEYWNPEYVVEWDAPRFILSHVGGGKSSSSASFAFNVGAKDRSWGNQLEVLKLAAAPKASDADSPYGATACEKSRQWEHMRYAMRKEADRIRLHKPHGQEFRPVVQADIDRLLDVAMLATPQADPAPPVAASDPIRWHCYTDDGELCWIESLSGAYVRYADHARIVAENGAEYTKRMDALASASEANFQRAEALAVALREALAIMALEGLHDEYRVKGDERPSLVTRAKALLGPTTPEGAS